jgi:hypothetical protein
MSSSPQPPPYYVLVSQSSVLGSTASNQASASVLMHPTVQYHYADDQPLDLLPTPGHANVIIVELEPHSMGDGATNADNAEGRSQALPLPIPFPLPATSPSSVSTLVPTLISIPPNVSITDANNSSGEPTAQSLSSAIAVTGVRVAQPPAMAAAFAAKEGKNPNIYIVDCLNLRPNTTQDDR